MRCNRICLLFFHIEFPLKNHSKMNDFLDLRDRLKYGEYETRNEFLKKNSSTEQNPLKHGFFTKHIKKGNLLANFEIKDHFVVILIEKFLEQYIRGGN